MKLFTLVCAAVMVIGCSKGKDADKADTKGANATPAKTAAADTKKADAPKAKEAPKPAAAAAPAAPAAAPAADAVKDDGKVVTVALTGNDQMKYNLTEIKVAAGRTIKLNLTHVGKLAAAAMGHNFVLLKSGTDVAAFATKAVSAAATGYIPDSDKGSVLAHTKVIGGGESTSIEFPAPPAGTYDYICSFPGHYAIMRGKLIVQ
ncbi:MAG: azurin [Myxococcota bacterium]|nr:azurin [Myxococcota bacterium]